MRLPQAVLLFLAALSVPVLCACAHTAPQPLKPFPKERADMTSPEAVTADKINLSVEEIGNRFLKLITGLDSRTDITPERIQDVMGFSVSVTPGALGAVVWSKDLGAGWKYAFDYVPESKSLLPGVGLSFENDANRMSDMKVICSLDFEHYDSVLKSSGFIASPTYGPIGQLENWRYAKFAKDGKGGNIIVSIVPMTAAESSQNKVCVKSISTLNGR
ncbi:hypothetical protein [Xanthomonas campestris]|uniref:hypothetical protein n=2 Tax=Xanthomonas campestris TaxID=339 RepID=UPI000E32ABA3|nr:hypothetical protein [Xanthomonas campestris]WDJ06264.1 hypothetical protein JH261_00805 [Xanthomonas campestris pv. incanae]MEA9653972.1 hypothetical protein [Xanthomonas campestris pv. raphani]MEA9657695.1 hypothetical protein [Xanthomonas campestris pv. raphani]MEA9728104.1 hypothetical protein [Xanthomonas campestris pv. raphani]MEA9736246.1 hypothetical protein [Xanthomonas campestris pv. raphani]